MTNNMPFGLSFEQFQQIIDVIKNYKKITEVILFGSRVKGTQTSGSDIDIAIKGDGLSIRDLADLELEFDRLLLPYKMDLVIYKNITDKDLLEHIARVGKVIYSRASLDLEA